MIDAHTHLNLNVADPATKFIDNLNRGNLDATVLILNTKDEGVAFNVNSSLFLENYKPIHLAVLLDINDYNWFEDNVGLIEHRHVPYSIKIHPRLTNITEKDFEGIYDYLKHVRFKNIIIDSFLYGSNKDNICFIELSVYLAKCFPNKRIIMAHFGGIKVLETMLRTRESHNIYYDCSFSINYLKGTSVWMDFRHCILHSVDRVLFGSDSPSFSVDDSVHALRDLLGEQSKQVYDKILLDNSRRVFFDE